MADTRYLIQRHHTWYFRLAVPAELRDALPKTHVVETLGTRDIGVAQKRRDRHKAVWEARFERLRAGLPMEASGDAVRSGRSVYNRKIERLHREYQPAARFTRNAFDVERDIVVDDALHRERAIDSAELPDDYEAPEDVQAKLDALDDFAEIAKGRQPAKRPEYGITVSEAVDRYLHSAGALAPKTLRAYRARLRVFRMYFEGRRLADLDRRDLAEFLVDVARLSPHWGKSASEPLHTWSKLKAHHQGPEHSVGLSQSTLNGFQSVIKLLWKWSDASGYTSGPNPAAGLSEAVRGRREETYLPFEPEHLKHLFADPVPKLPALWEMALVGLYSGMRLGEIVALTWDDVQERDGVWFFDIAVAKTPAGVRKVPVHSSLNWLLERRRPAGPLWPNTTNEITKKFGRLCSRRGISGPSYVFHSFRKNFTGCLASSGAQEAFVAEIVGHAKSSITYGRYNPGGLPLPDRQKLVEQVHYPALDEFFARHHEFCGGKIALAV